MTDRIHVVSFPFDLFGNAGTGAGATLLTDVVHEIIDDTAAESRPTRADAYRDRIDVSELTFETADEVAGWRTTADEVIPISLKGYPFTIWLGGNHLSALPVYEALNRNDLIVQFDAHLDLFDLHDTTTHLSHGNFLRHAKSLPTVINVGHRDLLIPQNEIDRYYSRTVSSADLFSDCPGSIQSIKRAVAKAKRVWIDLDVDVFDPAFCPAVHQSTPFGVTPMTVLAIIDAIWNQKLIGISISEFDPGRDHREQSLHLLGWLVEWLCLTAAERTLKK